MEIWCKYSQVASHTCLCPGQKLLEWKSLLIKSGSSPLYHYQYENGNLRESRKRCKIIPKQAKITSQFRNFAKNNRKKILNKVLSWRSPEDTFININKLIFSQKARLIPIVQMHLENTIKFEIHLFLCSVFIYLSLNVSWMEWNSGIWPIARTGQISTLQSFRRLPSYFGTTRNRTLPACLKGEYTVQNTLLLVPCSIHLQISPVSVMNLISQSKDKFNWSWK